MPLESIPAEGREVLVRLIDLAGPDRPTWLVGGALREILSGQLASDPPPADLDIAVSRAALELGRRLADQLGGRFVELDSSRGACRVVGLAEQRLSLDLVDLRAPTLEGDLRGRDFTVNALAVSIRDLVRDGHARILDPTGGLADLRARVARLCAPGAIADDPVRALRGVRLAMRPGWRLDAAAETAIRAAAFRLSDVAAERVRDELIGILAEPNGAAGLRALDRVDVLPALFPERAAMRATDQPLPHRFDVWEHSLRTVEGVDVLLGDLDLLAPWGPELRLHLAEELGGGLTRRETLKLAALLHDVAKPETRALQGGRIRFFGHDAVGARRTLAITERLRLPRRAAQVIERLVAAHLRPMHLAQAGEITGRARFRFFRDLAGEARDLLLLTLADASAVAGTSPLAVWTGQGGQVVRMLMTGAEPAAAAAASLPLLRGEDVMRAFGLPPGPEVGRLLERAREAQALGQVTTREEAIALLRRAGA